MTIQDNNKRVTNWRELTELEYPEDQKHCCYRCFPAFVCVAEWSNDIVLLDFNFKPIAAKNMGQPYGHVRVLDMSYQPLFIKFAALNKEIHSAVPDVEDLDSWAMNSLNSLPDFFPCFGPPNLDVNWKIAKLWGIEDEIERRCKLLQTGIPPLVER